MWVLEVHSTWVGWRYLVFCLFAKNPAVSKSGVTLLTCVAFGYFGSCDPGTSSFLTWSLWGSGGQGATAEGDVTHATLAGLKWVLL